MPPVTESLSKPTAAPERSLVQRMEALQRANDIRTRRAQLKRDLKAGRQPIHELLLAPQDYLETAKVFDFVPLLAYRFARERLGAIRRATGDTTIQCAALQLRQVTVQSSGPQTSAGNGSPRLWAMGSSLR